LKRGLIQIYTGDGKGKTTAAFGIALRAAGRGLRVQIYQFLKGGSPPSGEVLALDNCGLPIRWRRFDDQIPPMFRKGGGGEEELRRSLRKALEEVREGVLGGQTDLVILDEINVALAQGWLPVESVLEFLQECPEGVEVVLTGRGAPECLLERAHLVTEMRCIKHPFDQGVPARRGIEF